MALYSWSIRPAYACPRLTLTTGYDAPLAIAVNPTTAQAFIAPSQTNALVSKVDLVAMAQLAVTGALGGGNVVAMAANNGASPATILVAMSNTPATLYLIRQDTLATTVTLNLNAGEGPVRRLAFDGTYFLASIGASPGRLVVISAAGARLGAVTLNGGENDPHALTYDGAGNAFLGCNTNPGTIVKCAINAGAPTHTSAANLALQNIGALEYGRGYDGLLYAGAGAPGGTGATAFYQINPTTLAVLNTVTLNTLTNAPIAHMVFDTLSPAPGRYIYALLNYTTSVSGYLVRLDTGFTGGGFRIASSYNIDSTHSISTDSQIAFDGASLVFGSFTVPGELNKHNVQNLGLLLRVQEFPYLFTNQDIGELFQPIGADLPIARTYGVNGRANHMTHIVTPRTQFSDFYTQMYEENLWIKNIRPFGFLGDFGSDPYRWGAAVKIFGVATSMPEGPFSQTAFVGFNIVEIAI